jgi:hypothetical protein
MVTFYLIAFFILRDGEIINGDNHLGYTTGPTTPDELTRNVKSYLQDPNEHVILKNVQFLSREDYLKMGGHLQPGI